MQLSILQYIIYFYVLYAVFKHCGEMKCVQPLS